MIWYECGFAPGFVPVPPVPPIEFDYESALDDNGNLIYFRMVYDEDAGTWAQEFFYPPDLLTPVAYTGNLHPINEIYDITETPVCVHTAFGPFAVGDTLIRIKKIDLTSPGANAIIEYYDGSGNFYSATTAGPNVEECFNSQREFLAPELVLPFTDAAVVTLPAPPVKANLAELVSIGGDVLYSLGATPVHPVNENAQFEAESISEILAMNVTGVPGSSGNLIVRYFYVPRGGSRNS